MTRAVWVAGLLILPACFGSHNDMTGSLTTGAVTSANRVDHMTNAGTELAMVEHGRVNGVELRGTMAGDLDDPAIPNAYGFTVKQFGEGSGIQSSFNAGWMLATAVGKSTLFLRGSFDLLSWTKVGDDTTLSALSPTFEVGIAPFGHGICLSGAATWDVQFNAPDRGLLGAYVGICGGPLKH